MLDRASFYKFRGYAGFEKFFLSVPSLIEIPSEVFSIGKSVQGRNIYCLRLGDFEEEKPGALYISLVHGVEFIGGNLSIAVLRWFARGAGGPAVESILSRCNVYFLTVMNPDAYDLAYSERKKFGVTFARKNANGVDLNRNFPVAFGEEKMGLWSGLSLPFTPVYRGPGPFSEPETKAARDFILNHPIATSISFHSSGRMIGYPWCHKKDKCPDHDTLRGVALEMSRRQKDVKYKVMQEYEYVPTTGDMDDWLYAEGGVLPFLIEIGMFRFLNERPDRWFNPFTWVNMRNSAIEISNILPGAVYLSQWTAENADMLRERRKTIK